MGSKKKIGVRIDEGLWEEFKSYVERRHGRTRGVTADEVETALRNHLNADHPTDALARIENDVATIKAQLSEVDGGEAVAPVSKNSKVDAHTHRPTGTDAAADEKPHAKAPKSEKVEWYMNHKVPELPIVAPAEAFRSWVDEAWSFGERAGDDILRRVFDRYHAKAVKRDAEGAWEVVIAATRDERESQINQYMPEDGVIYILQNEDGTHVEGPDVSDYLLK